MIADADARVDERVGDATFFVDRKARRGAIATLERVRPKVVAPVLFVILVAWLGVVVFGRDMGSMPGTMGLGLASFVGVWALMMAAMLLPSVSPFASVYARMFGEHRARRMIVFVSGYLLIWSAAAFPAYGVAAIADRLIANHSTGATVLAVAIFVACGIYQLTPVKDRCLAWCRSPLGFTMKYSTYGGRTAICESACTTAVLGTVALSRHAAFRPRNQPSHAVRTHDERRQEPASSPIRDQRNSALGTLRPATGSPS